MTLCGRHKLGDACTMEGAVQPRITEGRQEMGLHCDVQVKKAGALDASAVEDDAEMASVARIRKPLWITVGIIIFMGFIVWPLLTLPAGDFRYVFDLAMVGHVRHPNCTASLHYGVGSQ